MTVCTIYKMHCKKIPLLLRLDLSKLQPFPQEEHWLVADIRDGYFLQKNSSLSQPQLEDIVYVHHYYNLSCGASPICHHRALDCMDGSISRRWFVIPFFLRVVKNIAHMFELKAWLFLQLFLPSRHFHPTITVQENMLLLHSVGNICHWNINLVNYLVLITDPIFDVFFWPPCCFFLLKLCIASAVLLLFLNCCNGFSNVWLLLLDLWKWTIPGWHVSHFLPFINLGPYAATMYAKILS